MKHKARLSSLARRMPIPRQTAVLAWPSRSEPFEHDGERETQIAWNSLQRQHERQAITSTGDELVVTLGTGLKSETMERWAGMLRDGGRFDERKYAAEVARARAWATAHGWEYEPDVEPVSST